ncbi:asparaginase [uncultured Roseibium sp.]|uniref:asparaginase n=1 Tax=uncultured Roseibium sp. TaxID=1936171 RepID=UPI00261D9178|nr:asparaginase [uncultured Roseibium sp.]
MGIDSSQQNKTVMVIGTGGTISCIGADPFDLHDYPVSGKRLSTGEMLDRFKLSFDDIHVVTSGFEPVSSTELGPEFWFALQFEILDAAQRFENLAGVVVTHGTATLEESAFALDLLYKSEMPVVFTGAQRPANAISTDAPHNLWSAILVAADPKARGRGVLVVMNGSVFEASEVTKTDNFTLDAFNAPNSGPVGQVIGQSVKFRTEPHRCSQPLDVRQNTALPRVDIIAAYAGSDGMLVEAAVASGARGLVVAGLPPGYATPDQRRALREARQKGIVVAMASRALSGATVSLRQNDVPDLIGSRRLSPQKARILLALSLMHTNETKEIEKLFAQFD